ncbi:hypothetical protein G5B35_17485 [Parapusillimonas sp. SGNA-6]|nr:hypothetical protein [Parapusillimonas sp. SGNA-6]
MDTDRMKDADHPVKADIKETTGVTSGNSESRPGDKVEKNSETGKRKEDVIDDDILDMPKE